MKKDMAGFETKQTSLSSKNTTNQSNVIYIERCIAEREIKKIDLAKQKTFDRLLALRFGCAAIRMAEKGLWGHMVAWQPPSMVPVPIKEAIAEMKAVPLTHDTIQAARDLGICLGD